jgi:hypothetical protein
MYVFDVAVSPNVYHYFFVAQDGFVVYVEERKAKRLVTREVECGCV